MKPARKFVDVLAAVIAEIPRDEGTVRMKLDKLRTDAWFRPPEGQHESWRRLGEILEARIPTGTKAIPAWAIKVARIVRGVE